MNQPESHWSPLTWGAAIALLAFSVATLIGIANGHEPDTVLWRALTGAGVAGGMSVVLGQLIQLAPDLHDDD